MPQASNLTSQSLAERCSASIDGPLSDDSPCPPKKFPATADPIAPRRATHGQEDLPVHRSIASCWVSLGLVALMSSSSVRADAWKVVDPETVEIVMYEASYALVVSIDDYRTGWPKLANANNDAKIVAGALEANGFDVEVARDLDAAALHERIKAFFVRRGADPQARLFLWFAGHGASLDGEGFLVPADAPVLDDPDFKLRAMHMRDFESYVRLARAKHVFAVFDSCFSGTIFDARRSAPPVAIRRSASLPVRQFLSSGDSQQEVLDDGTFAKVFVEAISRPGDADANRDGYVTGSEIGIYVADRITNLTKAIQTPRYGKLRDREFDRGDFVFTVPENMTGGAPHVQDLEVDLASARKGIRPVRVRIPADDASQANTLREAHPAEPAAPPAPREKSYTELIEGIWDRQAGR